MKVANAKFQRFKRFSDLTVEGLPKEARLVVLVGSNGTGKSSLFEGFNYWQRATDGAGFDQSYHQKANSGAAINNWHELHRQIVVEFHGHQLNPLEPSDESKKLFYFRTAYRNQADFKMDSLTQMGNPLNDPTRPTKMIYSEERVSHNYQSIVSKSVTELYDSSKGQQTAEQITNRLIGKVQESIARVFPGLSLCGPGKPLEGGTFLFEKGTSKDFEYKNLSGGEKAAFDLLLDFVVKSDTFDDTVFCIDEPELHLHTKLQADLLNELYEQLGANSQLWIATHSIGMIRRAMELHSISPQEVIFLDFSDHDFDQPVVLRPVDVDRQFWKKTFGVALDDIAKLVAPAQIVFCEGKSLGTPGKRNPSFDAMVYGKVFSQSHPDTEFVPLGGTTEVEKSANVVGIVLTKLFTSVKIWSVYDRDDRSKEEIDELKSKAVRVLRRRDLESYLWDDEVIQRLCDKSGNSAAAMAIIAEKAGLLSAGVAQSKPADDIKAASGQLYNKTKQLLGLTGQGNNAESFARDTLAPLLSAEMNVYKELHEDVFGA